MDTHPAPGSSLHLRSNIRHLYADVSWYGVPAGSSIAFLSVFAARLGASGFELAWVAAGPGLANLAFSLPFGRWLERRRLDRATSLASVWHRAAFLMIIPLPWILTQAGQIRALLIPIFLMSIPGTLLAIGFNALFADLVPADWRAQIVGRRNALLSVATAGTSLLCGAVLDRVAFPGNYQILFGIGFAGAALSSNHLSRLRQVSSQPPPVAFPLPRTTSPIPEPSTQGQLEPRRGRPWPLAPARRSLNAPGSAPGSFRPAFGCFPHVLHIAIPPHPVVPPPLGAGLAADRRRDQHRQLPVLPDEFAVLDAT